MAAWRSYHLAWREIRSHYLHSVLFALSIAGGAAGLTALEGVSGRIKETLKSQAREWWAADITVKAADPVLDELETWARSRWPWATTARSVDTLSMASNSSGQQTGPVTLSALGAAYPLYGKITTESRRPFHDVLTPGSVVVGDRLLKGWKLSVGDHLKIGRLDLTIVDRVAQRTDVPSSFFEFAPTAFITLEDLKGSGLMGPGSRSLNTLYLRFPSGTDLARALAETKARGASDAAEVAGWFTDNPGAVAFVQKTLLYLDFLALLALTLGGLGAATALSAALHAGRKNLGLLFALGAPRGYVGRLWWWWTGILSLVGLVLALVLGRLLATLLLFLFGDLLPGGLAPTFPVMPFLRAAVGGVGAAVLLTLGPLLSVGEITPHAILSDTVGPGPTGRRSSLGVGVLGLGGFFLLTWAQVGRVSTAALWVGGLGILVGVGAGLVRGVLVLLRWGLKKFKTLSFRLAGQSLARPGHLNDAVVFSIALSLTVIVGLFLLEKNLFFQMVERFPPGAPNVFFINLQPQQAEDFRAVLGRPEAQLFPLVRGRLVAINDRPAQKIKGRGRDRPTREFGFSYGEGLLSTDVVVEGPSLWDPRVSGPQVSVFDVYRKEFGIRRGDRLTVNVLGRRFMATVSSFRSIDPSLRQPFFYFYFRPGLLDSVPHTLMCGLSIPPDQLPDLQNRLAQSLPNVTVIDLSQVAALTGRLLHRLGSVVRVLGLFGLSLGLLLLLASVLASLASRVHESALLRVLGASRGQVFRVALLEYTLIGTVGAFCAFVLGSLATGFLLGRFFELKMKFFWGPTGLFLGAVVGLIVLLCGSVTRRALEASPLV